MADLTPPSRSASNSESVEYGAARLALSDGPVKVLTLTGEVDAAEAQELAAVVQPVVTRRGPGILDLSGVAFLSVAGFRALRAWSYQARETGANWVMVAGPAVHPYLPTVQPDELMPVASNEKQALDMLSVRSQNKLQMSIVDAGRTVC